MLESSDPHTASWAWRGRRRAASARRTQGADERTCTNKQIVSPDLGKTWRPPQPLAAVVGAGALVGPGRGLQLHSAAHHPGRLLWCGHRHDNTSHRVSPIWSSDDHGASHQLRATLPRGSTGQFARWGPDECQMAELADGTVLYNARENWAVIGGVPAYRLVSTSRDGGDTWAPLSYDTGLAETPNGGCQGSLISQRGPSDTLFFSHPAGWPPRSAVTRSNMTVRRSEDGGRSWPHALQVYGGGSAYSCLSPLPPRFASRVGLLFERDGPMCEPGYRDTSCLIAFVTLAADFAACTGRSGASEGARHGL